MFSTLKRKWNSLSSDTRFSEIFTGSIWALGARVLAAGFALATSILIARLYGAEMVGVVAVIHSFLLLATIFTALGTGTSILRLIPEHLVKYSATSAFRVYRKTQYVVIIVCLVTGILSFFGSHLIADKVFSKPHLSFYFRLAAAFVVFKSLMLLNTQAVRGLRLIRLFALMQLLPHASTLSFIVLIGLFSTKKDIPVYALLSGFAVTAMAGWLIMETAFKRRMQPQDSVSSVTTRSILSLSLPMLMTTAVTFVMAQTGVIMLGMFCTEAEVGYYAIAVKLATLTSFILAAINSMAAPKFSEFYHSGQIDELFYVAKKSAKLIFWTSAPILAGLLVLGKPILTILFGTDFAIAYPAMVTLVMGQFIHSISGSNGLFMNMTGHHKQFGAIMVLSTLLHIIMCSLLIPSLGMYGASIATMTTTVCWNALTLLYIKQKYGTTTGYAPTRVFAIIAYSGLYVYNKVYKIISKLSAGIPVLSRLGKLF